MAGESVDSGRLELMLAGAEGNVEGAYGFFSMMLKNDEKRAPESLREDKLSSVKADMDGADRNVAALFRLVVERYFEDQAAGIAPAGGYSADNQSRLIKASVLLLMSVRVRRMEHLARAGSTISFLSMLKSLSAKLLSFSASAPEQPLENVYAFYHYDAYPLLRALCEASGLGYSRELGAALAEPQIKGDISRMLDEALKGYYKG